MNAAISRGVFTTIRSDNEPHGFDRIVVNFQYDGHAYHAVFGTRHHLGKAVHNAWFVYPGPSKKAQIAHGRPVYVYVYEPVPRVEA